jgi:HEAT repeat protein
MYAFCTNCWSLISAKDDRCSTCGAKPEEDGRTFHQKLTAALEHPLPETRSRICWALGRMRARWAVPQLIDMLGDEDLFVRVAALRALGDIGDEAAIPALQTATEDNSVLARIAATNALAQIRRKSA